MTTPNQPTNQQLSRRNFIQGSSVAVAGALAAMQVPRVHAASLEKDPGVKIGLIGCGGRGTGAVLNAVGAAVKSIYPQEGYHTEDVAEGATVKHTNIQVLALADMFEDRLAICHGNLARLGLNVPKNQCFIGFDAYQKLLANPEINYVILATPPHFRPVHLKAAIEAGKNVFMEKPAAVDVPGVKMVMEAGQLAAEKKLGIAAGTQRRHSPNYRETVRRLHDGAIGDIVYAKCYWNGGQIWVVDRMSGWSDMEWQLRNWNYFTWLSGDHIVEQHVHNLDIMNWVIGTHPIKAVAALGGRQSRRGKRHGYVFDHFAVEYEYPNGVTMFSQCRQINRCNDIVGELVVGTKGRSNCASLIEPNTGDKWRYRAKPVDAYEQEHENLIASIRSGHPINEAQSLAESTLTAILGREAAYTGQEITWDQTMQSSTRLGPQDYEFGSYEIPAVPRPGTYRFS
ncbi:MAG: Gfo/Idh/MocA family oxidoreductase [Planctomycetes bacterium]|nr:Gfo/Idh/MocA family oxidoreductase [Planctomycetota bacterium]